MVKIIPGWWRGAQTAGERRFPRASVCPMLRILWIQMVFWRWDMGGHHLSISEPLKDPIVIPKVHHITKLIIAHCHKKTNHHGTVSQSITSDPEDIGYLGWVKQLLHPSDNVTCRNLRTLPKAREWMIYSPNVWVPVHHSLNADWTWPLCYCWGKETTQMIWSFYLLLLTSHPPGDAGRLS